MFFLWQDGEISFLCSMNAIMEHVEKAADIPTEEITVRKKKNNPFFFLSSLLGDFHKYLV